VHAETDRCCAYLTMDDMSAFVSDAELSLPAMHALGWNVEFVSWRAPNPDWNRYELVYICTPWDYQDDPGAYLDVLRDISRSTALLVNPVATVRWNLDKRYLAELESKGVRTVPSLWYDAWSDSIPAQAMQTFSTDKVVVKPQVGANADRIYVLTAGNLAQLEEELVSQYRDRPLFVQPFMAAVADEGEYSAFYFGGEYSHAILKVPRPGDFRSQEEHGADIRPAPRDGALCAAAEAALATIEPMPVYARADYVRDSDGRFLLMELELNEPALYFRTDSGSPARFAEALDAAWQRQS
jgi:hypothetical protein